MKDLSIYIHIPFCVKKCDYCDFLSAPANTQVQEQYLHALLNEIRTRKDDFTDRIVKTVFIGGGTPSILPAENIGLLMETLRETFSIAEDAEISMEVNPGTVKEQTAFVKYRQAGINRISIGLQSANDAELKLLGRIHNRAQFEETWQQARQAGFANLNVDIMAALPGQSVEDYRKTLDYVCALKPEHISAYSLIIEEGTPFFERYEELPENEAHQERDREMYVLTEQLLKENNYMRYEISNYAKPGKECRHNEVYWERGDYLGFGIGAASLINNVRYHNSFSLKAYIEAEGVLPYEEVQTLSIKEQQEEFFFLGLRMTKGVSKAEFKRQFGSSVESLYGEVLAQNAADGLLLSDEERVVLTSRGLDLSNYIFAQFL